MLKSPALLFFSLSILVCYSPQYTTVEIPDQYNHLQETFIHYDLYYMWPELGVTRYKCNVLRNNIILIVTSNVTRYMTK